MPKSPLRQVRHQLRANGSGAYYDLGLMRLQIIKYILEAGESPLQPYKDAARRRNSPEESHVRH